MMQHLIPPYSKRIEPFAWWQDAFSEEELNFLQKKAKESVSQAEVGGKEGGQINYDIRRSEVSWLNKCEETQWVFEKIANVVSQLNADYFRFSLFGFGESLQLTNYQQANQGTYLWHQDFGSAGPSRKLSVVIQLSDPNDYEGGQLQLLTSGNPTDIPKQRGLITVFPAWTLHQVTPVVKGSRQTLVTWICGEPFK
jgi:PKHD-type hydroxylase